MHKGCIRVRFTIISSSLKACRIPVISVLPFKKSAEKLRIPLVLLFLAYEQKQYGFSCSILLKNKTIFCRFCVLVSRETEKSCRYSLFKNRMVSCIFWNIFPTDFFQTKVYLFAQASSFVPSINTVSFDSSPASSNHLIIW